MNPKDSLSPIPPTLHSDLLSWYRGNGRNLPWRHTTDPYFILVSEIMLQQTQVSRVIEKYIDFIGRFPTLLALAEASPADVIRAWASLGYNVRARRLHELAVEVVRDHRGILPNDVEALRKLPGLGPYTAAAFACFAFDRSVAVIDTNIERVLNRVGLGPVAATKREIERLATSWTPIRNASSWHQGLMDIGAMVCKVRKPLCAQCPFNAYCKAAPYIHGEDPQVPPQDVRPTRGKQGTFKGSTRFYRGRIVESLRTIPRNSSIQSVTLAHKIFEHFNEEEHFRWFEELLGGLEKDGLIRLQSKRVRLP